MIGLSAATQVAAYWGKLHPAFGEPWYRDGWIALYPPWSVLGWGWQWYGETPEVFQIAACAGIVVMCLLVKPLLASESKKKDEARWATKRHMQQMECLGNEGEGPVLGKKWGRYLRYSGDLHLFAVGSTGTGKTAALIAGLLEWSTKRPRSVLIHDPKDSIYARTAGYRSQYGAIVRLAPLDADTDGYDPLQAVRVGTDDEYADVAMIASFLTNPDGKRNRDDTAQHFSDIVDTFFCGVLLYGLHSGVATTCEEFNDLVTLTEWPELVQVMQQYPHTAVKRSANIAKRIIDRELSSVQTTAARAMAIFSDPRIARMTSKRTFDLTMLREQSQPCTVYYSVPFGDQERLRPFTRLLMRQMIGHTTSKLTGWHFPLQIIIDELPSLDRLAIISEALNFAREYGVQLYCLTPSMEEIIKTFGQHHNFLESSFIQLVYGLYDPDVARRFSRRIGQRDVVNHRRTKGGQGTTVSEDTKQTPLMSETAVLKMRPTRVLITAGNQTCLATKARYFKPRGRLLPLWGQHRRWWLRSQLPVPLRGTHGVVGNGSVGG